MPKSIEWDKDELAKIRATPWSLHVPKETEVVCKDKKEIEKLDTQGSFVIARQSYLKIADFIKYGLTKGCPKCGHEISYGPGRASKAHFMICKKRILAEMSKTPEGQACMAQASERLDRTVAEMG